MMTLNEVGARLGISENHAENIVRATDAVVVPKWRRTEEFRNSVYGLAPSGLAWPSAFRRVTSMTS